MKKIILALMLMSAFVFADVHPALKEAIDTQNYKQAENLIKNVGIKDVYCPSTLSAKDADKIYGSVFSDSIGYLLQNCDSDFSRIYLEYKCAGGKNKIMCLNLVNLTDPNSWPEMYAKWFCTKKNVEVCAAAVERIPAEKSVLYLKAIKANKLASIKNEANKNVATSKLNCKAECEFIKALRLSGGIDQEILRKRDEFRMQTSAHGRDLVELQIREIEREERYLSSNNYCDMKCSQFNQPESESVRFVHFLFERPFYSLSQKLVSYYAKLENPIIPELAGYWSIVDDLIESSTNTLRKSVESAKDSSVKSTILNEYKKKIGPYSNYITKRIILDTLKAAFIRGEGIEDFDQLLYCKIYPSIEKDAARLLGEELIDCGFFLDENKKFFETCHDGDSVFGGIFKCVENKYVYVTHGLVKLDTNDATSFFTDPRDGKIYSKVKIDNQIWMAENLNYETLDSYCYNDKEWNCFKFGRLYKWESAKSACPDGWHLPSLDDFKTLMMAVGGKNAGFNIKSRHNWIKNGNGTDSFGFSALPTGRRYGDGEYAHAGDYAGFWSSTEGALDNAYYMFLFYEDDKVGLSYQKRNESFSVRCLQD